MDQIVELVKFIAESLVDNPDEIKITQEDDVIRLTASQSDMGKIIGKQGRIAKAFRCVVKSAAIKNNVRVTLDIVD